MDSTAVTRKGVLQVGVLSSSLPLLVLFGSNTFSSAQIALLQLILISIIQVLSSVIRLPRRTILPAQPALTEPIKIQLVHPDADEADDRPRESLANKGKSKETAIKADKAVEEEGTKLETVDETAPVAPQVLGPLPDTRPEHHLYSHEALDACLRNFLAVLDPSQLAYLPKTVDPSLLPPAHPLEDWPVLLDTPASRVAKHPSIPHLYSISASYPDVPLRNLWELLTDIGNRPKWDSVCQEAVNLDTMGMSQEDRKYARREASVDYLATKGMFLVKANDMVLLSVNARLRPTQPLKLVCGTTSVEHPDKPPTSSFSRMKLQISGFLAEEDGRGGSKVTQITDLSALGSWVPTRVIRMVTETMIPKSLVKIGSAAKDLEIRGSRAALQGDEWLPPVVGSWNALEGLPAQREGQPAETAPLSHRTQALSASQADSVTSLSPSSASLETEDVESSASFDGVSASSARDLREIVMQLRSVNTRLEHLETGRALVGPIPPRANGDLDAPIPVTGASKGQKAPPKDHSYRPPPAPFGVNKVTENSLTSPKEPMGWMTRLAGTLDIGSFVRGIGAGVFSTTTAATLAAILVYFFRKRGFTFAK